MPTFVGMTGNGERRVNLSAGWYYPMFSTHQNKPRIINLLHRFRGSCGTTIASYRVQTVSVWTPPGDASIASAS